MVKRIFGHTWEDIQAMQQGTYKPTVISGPPVKPQATEADIGLYEAHGLKGLEEVGFFGVIDRLRNSGKIA